MFEYWDDAFSAPLRRVVDPPRPVLVDLNKAIGSDGAFRADAVSMRVRKAGLDTTGVVPGLLYAWAECCDGSWIGLVWFAIHSRAGEGRIETRQWVPGRALSPRDTRNRHS